MKNRELWLKQQAEKGLKLMRNREVEEIDVVLRLLKKGWERGFREGLESQKILAS